MKVLVLLFALLAVAAAQYYFPYVPTVSGQTSFAANRVGGTYGYTAGTQGYVQPVQTAQPVYAGGYYYPYPYYITPNYGYAREYDN